MIRTLQLRAVPIRLLAQKLMWPLRCQPLAVEKASGDFGVARATKIILYSRILPLMLLLQLDPFIIYSVKSHHDKVILVG